MRIGEFIKAHRYGIIVFGITIAVSVFVGVLVGRIVKVAAPEEQEIVQDPSVSDSLLQDIDEQVKEINSKIPVKRPVGKRRAKKNDTIKLDAVIHIDNESVKSGEDSNRSIDQGTVL